MSTLQNTSRHHEGTRTRPGTALLALTGLIVIGLALLILTPTGHRASAPTTGSIAQPRSHAAALAAQTPTPAGCFRDPATHAITCYHVAPVRTATAPPASYFRDPATHKLQRLPTAGRPARQHSANPSHGRIIP